MKYIFILLVITSFIIGSLSNCEGLYRTIDGSCNNIQKPDIGKSGNFFSRVLEGEFDDEISTPMIRPNARNVSNELMATSQIVKNEFDINMLETIYAQFKTHDLVHNLFDESLESGLQIPIYPEDTMYIPNAVNNFILVSSSNGSISSVTGQYEILNNSTSWSDLSQVYGSTLDINKRLRSFVDGKLKTSNYLVTPAPNVNIPMFNLLPSQALTGLIVNTVILGGPVNTPTSGDSRANENIGLFALNVIYMREHNRIATTIKSKGSVLLPNGNIYNITAETNLTVLDEVLFQESRRRLIAQDQKILFEDYVPVVLHEELKSYDGYKPDKAIDIPTEFATGAFRYGHSSIANFNLRNLSNCLYNYTIPAGVLGPFPIVSSQLPNAGQLGGFFTPTFAMLTAGSMENVLMGLLQEKAEKVDALFANSVRIIKFIGSIGAGIDLATFDIVRGRVNGLPNYYKLRKHFHRGENKNIYTSPVCNSNKNKPIDPLECFLLITSNFEVATKLRDLYSKVNNIDGLVGLLIEDSEGKLLPRTLSNIIKDTYENLRDGDRFYYLNNQFSIQELQEFKSRTLSDIIRDNTNIKVLQDNAFQVQQVSSSGNRC